MRVGLRLASLLLLSIAFLLGMPALAKTQAGDCCPHNGARTVEAVAAEHACGEHGMTAGKATELTQHAPLNATGTVDSQTSEDPSCAGCGAGCDACNGQCAAWTPILLTQSTRPLGGPLPFIAQPPTSAPVLRPLFRPLERPPRGL